MALFLRILVEIFTSQEGRLVNKLVSGFRLLKLLPQARAEARHYVGIKLTYLLFYAMLLIMMATGLYMNYGESLKLGETVDHYASEVHENLMYGILVFALGHIIGVIVSENTKAPGIVSDMINGGPPKA